MSWPWSAGRSAAPRSTPTGRAATPKPPRPMRPGSGSTQLADVHATWEHAVRDLAGRLGQAQAGYDAWETATAPTRDRAVAADAELRRRHPDIRLEPLRGHAPPEPATATAAAEPRQPGPAEPIPVTDAEVAACIRAAARAPGTGPGRRGQVARRTGRTDRGRPAGTRRSRGPRLPGHRRRTRQVRRGTAGN